MAEALGGGASRISDVSLCHSFDGRDALIEREQALAICDLLGNNSFIPVGHGEGPYRLRIGAADGRFALHIADKGALVVGHYLCLVPFRRLLDMGRRGIHNQAADFPQEPPLKASERRPRYRASAIHAGLRSAHAQCRVSNSIKLNRHSDNARRQEAMKRLVM